MRIKYWKHDKVSHGVFYILDIAFLYTYLIKNFCYYFYFENII